MNRNDLTKILAKESGLSEKNAEKLIRAFGDTIADALAKNEKIVYSNFGTFYTVHYPSKVIYHPVLGAKKKMVMLPTDAVKWMPSGNIKDMVDRQKLTDQVTKFGSTKKLKQEKKDAGIPERKAQEVEDSIINNEDEIFEIPIHVTSNKKAEIVPIKEEEMIKEITPFASGSAQVTYIDLSKTEIPGEILCLVPEEIARRTKVIPIELKDEMLILGMTDPKDLDTIDLIKKAVRKQISPRLISSGDLDKIFVQYQKVALTKRVDEIKEPQLDPGEGLTIAKSAPANRILSLILKQAIREGAEKIHFEPQEKDVSVQYRIDGEIIEKTKLSKTLENNVLSKIRSISHQGEKQAGPTEGNFSLTIDNVERYFEYVSLPVASGEKIVISVKDQIKELKKIAELELRDSDYEKIKANINKNGLIIITSFQEVNRLTTMYALLDSLGEKGLSIASIEEHASLILPGVTQIEVIRDKGFTYDNVLESIVKLDPDVIAIDQFDNRYIIEQVLLLARNKIVIALMEEKDAFDAIERLTDLGIDRSSIFSSLNLVIAERSALKICSNCRTLEKIEPKTLRKVKELLNALSGEEKSRIRKLGSHFFEGKGCKECNNSGFKGEVSLFETITISEKIREDVLNQTDLATIKKEAIKAGMTTLTQDGIIKALVGLTEVKDILEK